LNDASDLGSVGLVMAVLSNPLALFGVEEETTGSVGGRAANEEAVSLTSEGVSSFTDSVIGTLGEAAFTLMSIFPVFHRLCLFVGSCDLASPSTIKHASKTQSYVCTMMMMVGPDMQYINIRRQWYKVGLFPLHLISQYVHVCAINCREISATMTNLKVKTTIECNSPPSFLLERVRAVSVSISIVFTSFI
jgi:hypothetical protein